MKQFIYGIVRLNHQDEAKKKKTIINFRKSQKVQMKNKQTK